MSTLERGSPPALAVDLDPEVEPEVLQVVDRQLLLLPVPLGGGQAQLPQEPARVLQQPEELREPRVDLRLFLLVSIHIVDIQRVQNTGF